MKNVIELENVVKDYGDFTLDGASFNVPMGTVCGFIGQNGAGKSTTINLILDIIKRDGGNIRVFGEEVADNTAFKDKIGTVFDEMGFNENMTPAEIGRMMSYIYTQWDDAVYRDLLKKLSLPLKKKCGSFSRGMRMKLQIAVAMSHHAKLLIMDEPTSGLDPVVRSEVLSLFREFVMDEENTIFLSSHITSDLEKIADELVFINAGKIMLTGNKDEILESHGIMRCKKEEAALIDKKYVVSVSSNRFGTDVLVNNRHACEAEYPAIPVDVPSLEDILVFYVGSGGRV
ncbi:MAG: ABC transporter ATP-binding protein [Clostridia bacterium]|nr:ABC transporter ATP-binding protein [Clostridia bacterium]